MHRLDELRREILALLGTNPTDEDLADKIFTAVQETSTVPIPWVDGGPANLGANFRMRLRGWCHEAAKDGEKMNYDRRR